MSSRFNFSLYDGPDPYAFVSYAHADTARLNGLLSLLDQSGVRLWYDHGIAAGTQWRGELADRIESCSAVLYCHSENARQSATCTSEVSFSLDNDIPVLCIILDDAPLQNALRLGLSEKQSVVIDSSALASAAEQVLDWLKNTAVKRDRPEFEISESSIRERYRLIEQFGEMGDRFAAFDRRSGRAVTLRMIPLDHALTAVFENLTTQDATSLIPEIETIHHVLKGEKHMLVASEFCDWPHFDSLYSEPVTMLGNDGSRIKHVALKLADAIQTLHSMGCVHGSVLPGHIQVSNTGQTLLRFHNSYNEQEGGVVKDWQALGTCIQTALSALQAGGASLDRELESAVTLLLSCNRSNQDSTHVRLKSALTVEDSWQQDFKPFVGRENELELIHQVLAQETDKLQVVAVSGESGVGKSRLVARNLSSLEDTLILQGVCHAGDMAPFKGIQAINEQLVEFLNAHPERASLAPRHSEALTRLFPVFAESLVQNAHPKFERVGPSRVRRLGTYAYRELLGRIAERTRVVLWLDDYHYADADTRVLMESIIGGFDAPNMSFVFCAHSQTQLEQLNSVEETQASVWLIRLQRLSAEESRRLGTLLGEDDGRPKANLDGVVQYADGLPFMIELLVKTQDSISPAIGDATQEDIAAAIVGGLTASQQKILQCLAIAKVPLSMGVLESVMEEEFLVEDFLQLSELRFIRYTTTEQRDIEIYHAQLGELVLRATTPSTRRDHHKQLFRALEASNSHAYNALYIHASEAGLSSEAFEYLMKTAQDAVAKLAFSSAVQLYERALQLRDDQPPDIYPRLAEALVMAGQPTRGAETYLVAASFAIDTDLSLEYRRLAAYQFAISGHFDQASRLLKPVLQHFRIPNPSGQRRAFRWVVRCIGYLARRGLAFEERNPSDVPRGQLVRLDVMDSVARCYHVVDNIRGVYFAALSLLTALKVGDTRRILKALDLANSAEVIESAAQGLPAVASRMLSREQDLARRTGDNLFLGRSLISSAQKDMSRGKWQAALDESSEGIDALTTVPDGQWEVNTGNMIKLRCLEELGDLQAMNRLAETVLQSAEDRGDFYAIATAKLHLSYGWLARGNPVTARLLAEEVDQLWSTHNQHMQHFYIFRALTCCDLYEDKVEEAKTRLDMFRPEFTNARLLRVPMIANDYYYLCARIALRESGAAVGDVARYVAELHKVPRRYAGAHAPMLEACVALKGDDIDVATNKFVEARAAYTEQEMFLSATYAAYGLSRVTGTAEQKELQRNALGRLNIHGIEQPKRWLELHAPGVVEF